MNRADWTPDLLIAGFIILACFTLRILGINGEVWSTMGLAVGWVFGGQFHKRRLAQKEATKVAAPGVE